MKILNKRMATSYKAQKGSVLVEFTLVLPLLLILFVGILELGRALNETSWLIQASYQSAKLGSESPRSYGEQAMSSRGLLMSQLQNKFVDTDSINITPEYLDDDLVSTSISGKLNVLTPYLPINLSVRIVGPYLLRSAGSVDNLGVFSNPPSENPCLFVTCAVPGDFTAGRGSVSLADAALLTDIGPLPSCPDC